MTKILVVDDETDIRFVIGKMLEREGYGTIEADSGEQALEVLKDEEPDLILLDVMMPGLDGYETCMQIKSQEATKNIPIVMLTAKTAESDKIKALEECGAQWHISKPIDRKKFIETVKWLLASPPRREE
ncbi:MAG TPA: response regulator [Euryarchaeota archaeon]|nr:alkaline phosphatase synthesis transcriptional regulatory protein PhoP [archaeon BMS3Abin16]GBE56975.1 alkaline phosphatase synthesis transcriptional regulatory protein PhoP [archaeon BMS3Bbin16]HDH27550.1 response regulator [Euryarchaeota archaeon]